MKTANPSNGSLSGLVHNSQATIHNLSEHVRSTADKPRRLLDTRKRNDLLRELGRLYFDAHNAGADVRQSAVDRLFAQLETEPRNHSEDHESADGNEAGLATTL